MVSLNRVLVIGASGRVGRHVVYRLQAAGTYVRALARNPHALCLPSQVDVVHGDLTVPESLEKSLKGIDAVFLVWTAPPQTVVPVVEQIAKHALRVVFLSSPYKTPHPFFQKPQPNAVSALHNRAERAIATSGLEWTFLQPGMFAANALLWWAPQIRSGDIVRWPYLAAPTAPIDEQDIAAVAVRALCNKGHAGAEYVLTGPQSITQYEQVSMIGRVIGRSLYIEEISPEQARNQLFTLWPPSVADMLLEAWAAAVGQPAFVTSTVADVTGARARSFFEWATDHISEFQA
jgi:uncharacterized protein YbjT (DUF2867 family)